MGLVLHDRSADHAAPLTFGGRRLRQAALLGEEIRRRQRVRRRVPEEHALELVRARLGDGVDDRAARPSEFRVVHARHDLEFLDRFERGPHLRARARAERIVGIVAAVDRHEVVLARLPRGDDGVVAHLVRRRELNAGHQGDGREVVAVHRRQLAQFVGADVAADLRARRVDERRLGGDFHRFRERSDAHRPVDDHRLPDLQDQAVAFERREALELRDHVVSAGAHLRRREAPIRAGQDLAERAGLLVGERDGHARQGAALFIRDPSGDFGGSLLCKGVQRKNEQYRSDVRNDPCAHRGLLVVVVLVRRSPSIGPA